MAFFQQSYLGKSKLIKIISKSANVDTQIPLYKKLNHDFISLKDFAKVMHYSIYTNDAKKKSVLYMGKDRIRFTADNSFVIHNDNAAPKIISLDEDLVDEYADYDKGKDDVEHGDEERETTKEVRAI